MSDKVEEREKIELQKYIFMRYTGSESIDRLMCELEHTEANKTKRLLWAIKKKLVNLVPEIWFYVLTFLKYGLSRSVSTRWPSSLGSCEHSKRVFIDEIEVCKRCHKVFI